MKINKSSNNQFNPDGSIKLPKSAEDKKAKEKHSIIISREQIHTQNPAIAQIKIELSEEFQNPEKIINFYNKIKNKRFPSVDHIINQRDKRTIIIKVKNGSKFMYSFFEYLIETFRLEFKKEIGIVDKGSWDKY